MHHASRGVDLRPNSSCMGSRYSWELTIDDPTGESDERSRVGARRDKVSLP